MRNQFFYTVLGSEVESQPTKLGSFNPDYVIRSIQYAENRIVVLLDDFHEIKESQTLPVGKNGKTITKTSEDVVCSEIFLNEDDSNRFMNLCSISTPSDMNKSNTNVRQATTGSNKVTSDEQVSIPTLA